MKIQVMGSTPVVSYQVLTVTSIVNPLHKLVKISQTSYLISSMSINVKSVVVQKVVCEPVGLTYFFFLEYELVHIYMSSCTKDWTVRLVLLHYLCHCSEEKLSGSITELKSAPLALRMAMGRLCSFCMTYAPIEWWYYHPTHGEKNIHLLNVLCVPFQLHCKCTC